MTEAPRVRVSDVPALSPTLPAWAYTDAAVFEREKTEVFYRSWQYAGWAGDVARPGDFLTAEIAGQGVLIVRGADGGLRGFHNTCRHRGHPLLAGCGQVASITCPYHAWSYGTDGALRTARGLELLPGFDPSEFALRTVRVDVLAGKLVFFNLDPDAEPLARVAASFEEELHHEVAEFAALVRVERSRADDGRMTPSTEIRANWKIAIDNCLECYHCRPVHPGFRRLIDMASFQVRAHEYWASLKGRPEDSSVIPPSAINKKYGFWWLWPNTFIEMAPGGAHGITVGSQVPLDVARTGQGPTHRYGLPGAPLFEPRGYDDLNLVPEDRAVMEAVQRNMSSLGYGEGRFSYDPEHGETSEEAVHRFHWLVARALGFDRA